jgi:peptidyl-dipeptidase Dcp
MTVNPFFEASALPYQLPPFTEIREEHYRPAFERGMEMQLAEVEAIASSSDAPTFSNTLVALELSGAVLRRVRLCFDNQNESDTTPGLQALEAEMSPRLAAHRDSIYLDSRLYSRVAALYAQRDSLGLDPVSVRLISRYHTDFVRAGARLSAPDQARLRELNARLAELSTAFDHNLLADTRKRSLVLDSAQELAGLSHDAIAAAEQNAKEQGFEGKYLLSLHLWSNQPELAFLRRRDVRERLLTASVGRGWEANSPVVVEIARLRAERAALLGYSSHADYHVEDQTAGTVAAVEERLSSLVPAAVANARQEEELLRAAFVRDGYAADDFAAWDWQYYSEKVRKAEYDVDESELRPYFELERVLQDGVFYAAQKVYGIRFEERSDLRPYSEGVRVFEVVGADGSTIGLYLGDFYARASKRGGAWMNELVEEQGLTGAKPVVVNNLNIAKPPEGEPTLLTFDEVNTFFHEFGHALHGLFSRVRYPKFAGTQVALDFVEYPSQVNEMWAVWPEVLENYAKHYESGEPIPAELLERMRAAEKFGQGFRTVEYLGATLLDWAWHTIAAGFDPGDPEVFEREALERAGIAMDSIPPRYRSAYFAHSFAYDYSAGYYSYIWSEVLDADTVEWFKENGGMTRANGDAFREAVLSKGGSVDAIGAFRSFRGRDPEIGPLLKRRGLV